MKLFRRVLCFLLLSFAYQLLLAETWYVRPDGGTRHSSKVLKGECDGKADVAYPGTGINQHCAFKDVRYLWTDATYTVTVDKLAFPSWGWIGKGGDTYIVRGGPWRVGQGGANPTDGFGLYGDPYDAGAPVIPSGTAAHHTRLLGEHFDSCNATNKTQLFGGYGVGAVLDLNAGFVDVQCIELTRHSTCTRVGVPAYPRGCKTNFPLDDYAGNGITTGTQTHDLLLEDMWIHGFTHRGIIGAIGGTVNAKRVDIAYNGSAGWDFDDGKATPMVRGALNLDEVIVEWNGCNQNYPRPGALSCFSQGSGGYGDGMGGPPGTCLSVHMDHSIFRYNTQDGFDMLHNDTGPCTLSITNSMSYGNNGAQFKWGSNNNPAIFSHNIVLGNCLRLSEPIAGTVPGFNRELTDYCRAEDTMMFSFRQGSTLTFTNNTIIGYSPTLFDVDCADSSCSNATFTFKDNVVMGYNNAGTYKLGGQHGGPGGFYFGKPIGHINRSSNVFYGVRGLDCEKSNGEVCADPKFVGEPRFTKEEDLDQFNFHRASGAPLPGAGAFPL